MENTSQQPRQATQLTQALLGTHMFSSSCMKPVTINHRAILCDNCGLWAHIKCENIPKNTYVDMNNNKDRMLNFICSCVFFYVNEQLESHPLKHLSDSNYESLWIKVCLSKTKPIFHSVVYRPPSNGSDLDSIYIYTENLCTYLLNNAKNNFLEVMRFSFVEI